MQPALVLVRPWVALTCEEAAVHTALSSRARFLANRLLEAEGEESLHLHDSGNYQTLHPKLQKSHESAKDASRLVDQFAKNWPERERRYLHGKAAEEHTRTAQNMHAGGFTHLARQHLQWAHYHASHAQQQAAQSPGLVHHNPHGGHARSGHTLPKQAPSVQHYGDVPSGAVSHQKAQETGTHWNDRSNQYQEIPSGVAKLQKKAHRVSKSVQRISVDPSFSHAERAQHHRAAAGHHVQAASELMRHGFNHLGGQHMNWAQHHTQRAAEHDTMPSPKALPPGPEKET